MLQVNTISTQRVVTLINSIGEESFFNELIQQIRHVVACDSLVVMLYSDNALPDIIHDEIRELSYRAFKDIYLKGAYLLSPLYIAHRQKRYGVHTFSDLLPDGFYQSEYYLSYYSKCGLTDQLILLTKINEHNTLAISLGLLSGHYSTAQHQPFAMLAFIMQAAIEKHWQMKNLKPNTNLKSQLQRTFDLFTSAILTKREQAVVHTLMQGHSSKSAAKKLNISVDTERSYRKSAYAKLGISSQSELFNLFFSCLNLSNLDNAQDPILLLNEANQKN